MSGTDSQVQYAIFIKDTKYLMFWSNTIWYILLAISNIIIYSFAIRRSENRSFTIAFSLAVFGFVVLVEALLIILLGAYTYCPGIVDDPFQDSVLGNIFSQTAFTSAAMLIITYKLKYKWYPVIAAIYCLIEETFVRLGILRHYWYRTVITFVGFTFLFWFFKKCYEWFISPHKFAGEIILLFLAVFAAFNTLVILPLKLLKLQVFQVMFFGIYSKDHSSTVIIYDFIAIIALISLYKSGVNWVCKALSFAAMFSVQYVLYRLGIILSRDGWIYFSTLADILGIYLLIVLVDRLLSRKPKHMQPFPAA